MKKNVWGGPFVPCSTEPLTGFYRDGTCSVGPEDTGCHAVCAEVTEEFRILCKDRNVLDPTAGTWAFLPMSQCSG